MLQLEIVVCGSRKKTTNDVLKKNNHSSINFQEIWHLTIKAQDLGIFGLFNFEKG